GRLEHFLWSWSGETLSYIKEVGNDKNRKDRRLGNDERGHRDLAAIRQGPGLRCFRIRSCDCAHCSLPIFAAASVITTVRIFWMFQIPQRSSACDNRNRGKVVGWRRRTRRPLERPGIPRIVPRFGSFEIRNDEVPHEDQDGDRLNECTDRDDQVQRVPT